VIPCHMPARGADSGSAALTVHPSGTVSCAPTSPPHASPPYPGNLHAHRTWLSGRTQPADLAGDPDGFDSHHPLRRCVAICHRFPHSSLTVARRSPYGVSVGSSIEAAFAAIARLNVESASST